MSSNIPYLGSKISIISKSEIRYEGILYTVDTKDSTIALAKVKSFGTEGRPTERPVAPRDEIYEYIIFRASDIKDLHVCEPPKAHHGLPPDPAIVQQSGPVSNYSSTSQPHQSTSFYGLTALQNFPSQLGGYSCMPSYLTPGQSRSTRVPVQAVQRKSPTSDAGVQVSVGNEMNRARTDGREPLRQRNMNQMNYQPRRRSSITRQPNMRRNIPRRRGRSNSLSTEKFEDEYDFEQANAEFQELENKLAKNSIGDDNAEQSPTTEDQNFSYDKKKSFFDDISCEATQRSKGLPRFDWRYERKLNVETFGVQANNAWLRRRRNRGNMRRGFRGRGGYNRTNENIKTVTFDETPTVKEVEVVTVEEKVEDPLPVIEVVADKEKDWPEPAVKAENVWN